jgi:peroxiredoxin
MLNQEKTILTFYRGSWCPYCNFTLQYYNDLLKEQSEIIHMIAISPELPSENEITENNQLLQFSVATDTDCVLSKSFGLIFKMPLLLRIIYRLGGIHINRSQGNKSHQLPVPATYIIDKKGTVLKRWIDVDYKKRAAPEEVIKAFFSYK